MPIPTGIVASGVGPQTLPPIPTTGLLWWFDPSDAATISATGGLVDQMNDKSGNANHAVSSGTLRPTIAAGGVKAGVNSLDFAGAQRMDITNGYANQKPFSIFAVIKHTNTAAYRGIVGGPSSGGFEWRLSNTHKQSFVKAQVAEFGLSAINTPANIGMVLSATYSATGVISAWADGVSVLAATNDQAFSGASALAYIGTGIGEPWTGSIAEVIKYDHELTTTERQQVESYLMAKWGGNKAVSFNAVSQKLTRSATGLAGNFTMTCWVKINVDTNAIQVFIGQDNAASNYYYLSTLSDGTTIRRDATGGAGGQIVPATVGLWYFLATVNDTGAGNDLLRYKPAGGTLTDPGTAAAGTVTGPNDANTLFIGNSGFNNNLNGSIAAVKIWNAVLTAAEIAAEADTYAPVKTSGLWAAYSFKNGPQITDDSGNGRTLTMAGAPTSDSGPPIT